MTTKNNASSPPPHNPKLFLTLLLTTLTTLTILFQLQYSLKQPLIPSPSPQPTTNTLLLLSKLRDSVTFTPFKDLRFSHSPTTGHTWFMSSINDTHRHHNEPLHLYFPSHSSKNRVLCLNARHHFDGTKNFYAFSYPNALPYNSTLLHGLTVIFDTQYDYNNPWHGLSAVVPFLAWHEHNKCVRPERLVLFHWGELRTEMGNWVKNLTEATIGNQIRIEDFGEYENVGPVCFERAVVFRHSEGGLSKERRGEVYDMVRCKARKYCNVNGRSVGGLERIRTTLLLRDGGRAFMFKNETASVGVFDEECRKVEGCVMKVARSNNLTFCDQVKLLSETDILVSPHGAQLTNLIFMDRNSSVLEFYPRGWLEFAGMGQYVFRWMSDWAGMRHQGAWRDQEGDKCPHHNNANCFAFYKDSKIGHNETYFASWMANVLREVKEYKLSKAQRGSCLQQAEQSACACD